MPPRAGLWVVRLLAAIVVSGALTGWSASAQSPGASPRVVIIGDQSAGPDAGALAHVVTKAWSGPARLVVADYSQPGAGLEAIVRQQLGSVIDSGPDLVILRLGAGDMNSERSESIERSATLVSALLATLATRTRARMIVSTIPWSTVDPVGDDRLTMVRRLRQIELHNDAVRAIAERAGASVIAGDERAGARVWRTTVEAALGRGGDDRAALDAPTTSIILPNSKAVAALRERAMMAQGKGQQLQVIAKVGDSITAAPEFLASLVATGTHSTEASELAGIIAFFNSTALVADGADGVEAAREAGRDRADAPEAADGRAVAVRGETSFTRRSLAARARWAAADVLSGGSNSALARELAATRPGAAVVMFGTNDLTRATVEEFEDAMDHLLAELEAAAVIPVLNTIPMRADREDFGRRVPAFNAAIRALAAVHGVPLIDYGAAMSRLPALGLADDGIHPSVCPEGPAVLSPTCVQYGYNLRNLLTLRALDMLRMLMLEAPDATPAEMLVGAPQTSPTTGGSVVQ